MKEPSASFGRASKNLLASALIFLLFAPLVILLDPIFSERDEWAEYKSMK